MGGVGCFAELFLGGGGRDDDSINLCKLDAYFGLLGGKER